jgi:protein-L-isoaspartate(D-aspartate) O-methyltransferase
MSEAANQARTESHIGGKVIEAASYLVKAAMEMQSWSGNLNWSKRLVAEGVLKTPELIRAFSKVKRIDFLPEDSKLDEGYDRPLPIGHEQTNSQPTLVASMLELLKVQEGQSVLDVGTGSGWTTGLLAAAIGDKGRVVGAERIAELVEVSKANLAPYEFSSVHIEHVETGLGIPSQGPYDRILVSAHMLEEWVPELGSQLSEDGIMVAPIATNSNHGSKGRNQHIGVITRSEDKFAIDVAMNEVGFVPLIRD